ncbi:MAG: SIS domain-containing protein [Ignavibacteriaceae bacterium]
MNRINKLYKHVSEYRENLLALFDGIEINILEKIVAEFIRAYKGNNTIFICGNGGSAATASHFQVDFAFFVRYFARKRFKIRSLTDHVPMITAIGNDHSYEDIFYDQLKDNFVRGDVLVAISASGNSMNVVKAVQYANELGGTTIGLVGFRGGKLKENVQICLYTPNPEGQYGPIEDLHMIIDHLIISYLAKDEEFQSMQTN